MTDIFIKDDLHPEDIAMLQALYSRSPASVLSHLEKVREVGSGKFMDQYYVGYNHKSIGDCGTTTLFLEGISMLAAKAIQATPLYSGQEASTRYLDMAKQPVLNPADTEEGSAIQNAWMDFYKSHMPAVVEHLKEKYPRQEGESKKQYDKAIHARSFDIMRGFLPAGCTTNASWHTNLRQAWDHLSDLRHYPTQEVRDIAAATLTDLQAQYPNSFNHKLYPEIEEYLSLCGDFFLYDTNVVCNEMIMEHSIGAMLSGFELYHEGGMIKWWDHPVVKDRPQFAKLPHILDSLGQVMYEFPLDFGSFRDLQRHRNGVCRMPLLSTKHGFHAWYINNLPEDVRAKAIDLIGTQEQCISKLDIPETEQQYYVAMGFNVACEVTRGLPGTVYLIELRTAPTVHPTMRQVAQDMGIYLKKAFPNLTLHADMSPDTWSIRRGGQDIETK